MRGLVGSSTPYLVSLLSSIWECASQLSRSSRVLCAYISPPYVAKVRYLGDTESPPPPELRPPNIFAVVTGMIFALKKEKHVGGFAQNPLRNNHNFVIWNRMPKTKIPA